MLEYFTEIELLKNRINELEEKLQNEREEYREVYSRLKHQLMLYQNSNNLKIYSSTL
jgi:flagellar capping protein FliD